MKFGQLIESNKRNNFLRKLCRKWGSETTSRPLFKKKKTFYEVNTSDCSLVSIYFDSPQLGIQYNKLYKTLGYWSRDVLNFSFLEKGLEVVSRPYFVYEFSTKMFLMFYSRNWPNFIVWLLFYFLRYWPICVLQLFVNQKLQLFGLISLIKPFLYMTKRLKQKLKNFESEKSF